MILGILMSNEVKIAVLETQVERLLEKQKELTERVRANEKVVAAIGLFGSVAVAFIGAGYFAPKAEAHMGHSFPTGEWIQKVRDQHMGEKPEMLKQIDDHMRSHLDKKDRWMIAQAKQKLHMI